MRIPPFAAAVLASFSSTLALSGSCACGSSEETPPARQTPPAAAGDTSPAPPSPSAPPETTERTRSSSARPGATENLAAEPYASETLGALHGEVRFLGVPPERFKIVASEKPECAAHPEIDHLSELVIVNDGKLQNVLVRLTRGVDVTKVPPPPAEPAHLDQRGCTYVPHVLALQAGRTLLVGNSDAFTHNVNVTARKNDISSNHNVGADQRLTIEPAKDELSIRFKCDIHPWMGSWLHVIEHPWFAVTDAHGAFQIRDVPPGKYTVELVHEEYGKLTARDVVVEAGKSTGIAASYP